MKQEIPYSSAQLLYYAWQLSRNRGGADDDKLTGVLSEARVDLNPHQVMAALFAFQSPFSKGVILADEVGVVSSSLLQLPFADSGAWSWRKSSFWILLFSKRKRGFLWTIFPMASKSISALISLLPDKPKSCRALIGTWWFMMRLINCAMFISQPLRWLPV